jgi:hypothetical protein
MEKYKYRLRPEFGSKSLILEFVNGVEKGVFGRNLFDALKEINPKHEEREDLWLNDEVLCTVNSDLGQFTLSKDIWGFAFIMANDNQSCILQINNLLLNDNRFEKIEIDFDDFKLYENVSN